MGPAWGAPTYELELDGRRTLIDDAQWAEWSSDGSLLIATRAGALEVRESPFTSSDIRWTRDLAPLTPAPEPPPPEAARWT
jgi:hypothetical protein